jgi:probable metal-binding protein
MTPSVHGHIILQAIIDAGGQLPLEELRTIASSRHGGDATYHTCSAQGMSFDGLIEFLTSRKKTQIEEGRISVFVENMCEHGDAAHTHSDDEPCCAT